MIKQIKITLIKSIIGRQPKHVYIAKQLGLRKLHKTVVKPDNPAIRGLTNCIAYLLKIEDCT